MKEFKKVVSVALTAAMAFSVFACSKEAAEDNAESEASETVEGVMSHDEYIAADIDTPVKVDVFVQATQSWWDNTITVYAADEDGAYFIYGMECSEEDAAILIPGTEIIVDGFKSEWSGEVEIIDATFEFVQTPRTYFSGPYDLTVLFGNEEMLLTHQNEHFSMTGLTVEAIGDNGEAFLYKYDGSGSVGDDLYFKVSNGTDSATFTVESYLTGSDTEVYQTVEGLAVGDTIDVEGFLYWYEGPNPHITSVTVR